MVLARGEVKFDFGAADFETVLRRADAGVEWKAAEGLPALVAAAKPEKSETRAAPAAPTAA